MIVEPDFLSHWKTRMLVGELQDRAAPVYVLSMWSFCQQRKTDRLPGNADVIASICGYEGDSKKLLSAMLSSGFLEKTVDEGAKEYIAHGFREVNAKLFSNWENGKSGGRPKNPTETQRKPKRNPRITQTKPTDNPSITDKIRLDGLDKSREEKIEDLPTAASSDAVGGEAFYLTKKKRKLTGKRLETFERFWKAFDYPKGKADAADAWLDVPQFTEPLVERICQAAQAEARKRPGIIAAGKTPKMAQGWISSRRWEDYAFSATNGSDLGIPVVPLEEEETLLRGWKRIGGCYYTPNGQPTHRGHYEESVGIFR